MLVYRHLLTMHLCIWQSSCVIANNASKEQKLFVQDYNLKVNLSNLCIFINPPLLPLLCEISGALHLAQSGLMTGWQAGRRNTGELRNF